MSDGATAGVDTVHTLPSIVADPAVTTALAADLTAAGFTVDRLEQ